MLDRLEAERADSSAVALSAQEDERQRIAQELHDEVGQTLTAVLLELKHVADHAPPLLRSQLRQVQETTGGASTRSGAFARRLRPGVLDELGLSTALTALTHETTAHAEIAVTRHFDQALPQLSHETELVIYRVAQESLTNIVRHAEAHRVTLSLGADATGLHLRIADDGKGLGASPGGAGIRGMRERALLIGARLTLNQRPGNGTEVHLRVPAPQRSP